MPGKEKEQRNEHDNKPLPQVCCHLKLWCNNNSNNNRKVTTNKMYAICLARSKSLIHR